MTETINTMKVSDIKIPDANDLETGLNDLRTKKKEMEEMISVGQKFAGELFYKGVIDEDFKQYFLSLIEAHWQSKARRIERLLENLPACLNLAEGFLKYCQDFMARHKLKKFRLYKKDRLMHDDDNHDNTRLRLQFFIGPDGLEKVLMMYQKRPFDLLDCKLSAARPIDLLQSIDYKIEVLHEITTRFLGLLSVQKSRDDNEVPKSSYI